MPWRIGDTLKNGEYRLEKELNNDGRCITYRARHKDGSLVAIKVLDDRLLQSLSSDNQQKMRETFNQEAVKLAKCRNSHIVKVGMPFIEENRECLVMQYINGQSLAESTTNHILSEEVALEYIQQIGEALIVVHENGLTHRDVQPRNIILDSQDGCEVAILTSFSLAVEQNEQIEVLTQFAPAGFAPPELYSRYGGVVGVHTDVYSLAATLYYLLTGIQPKTATERKDVIENQINGRDPLPAPIGHNSKISDRTNQAIINGLELDPKSRPSSMEDWLVSLGLQIDAPSMTKILEPPSSGTESKKEDNWWNGLGLENQIKVIGAVAATMAAIGGLLSGIGNFNKPPQNPPSTPISTPAKAP